MGIGRNTTPNPSIFTTDHFNLKPMLDLIHTTGCIKQLFRPAVLCSRLRVTRFRSLLPDRARPHERGRAGREEGIENDQIKHAGIGRNTTPNPSIFTTDHFNLKTNA